MKHLMEEYGKVVLVIVAVVAVFACLFVYLDLYGYIRDVASVDSGISHEHGEGELDQIVNQREKPVGDFSAVTFRIYSNQVFRHS